MARRPVVLEATQRVDVTLRINGEPCRVTVDTRSSVLDVLREQLDLTGTKKGCDHGQCGACTVLLDGRRINGCLALAVAHDGAEITTIEGLAGADGTLHPLQEAFVAHDGFQCGYCTSGQICSAVGAIDEARRGWPSAVTAPASGSNPAEVGRPVELDAAEIRERMSGNLCRCGAYPGIVAAIEEASR